MQVLFNGASAIRPKTGVGHTTANLHRALVAEFPRDTFWLYPGERARRLAARFFRPQARIAGAVSPPKSRPPSLAKRLAVRAARLGYASHFHAVARLRRFDLYHEPNLVPFRVPLPTVVTVHDLSVILFPNWHPAERVKRYEQAFARGVAAAAHILVDSDAVRGERSVLGPPNRVTTVHCASADFRPQSPEEIAAVHGWLFPALPALRRNGWSRERTSPRCSGACIRPPPSASRPLVLGGTWGGNRNPARTFEAEGAPPRVRYLGYVADETARSLCGAEGAFLPSHYEGFGLPPVEMMACGGAAVVSTADAVREVVGANAPLLDPNDLEGWRDAMHHAITDPDSLAAYRRNGPATAARFSWSNAARQTFAVYQSVLGISRATADASPRAAA